MTVAELIRELQKFDEDKVVEVEGCDCIGLAKDVETSGEDSVLITR